MAKKRSKKGKGKKPASKKAASKKTSRKPKKSRKKSQVEAAAAKISRTETELKALRHDGAETKDMVKELSDAKFHFKNKDYKKSISSCNKAMRISQLAKKRKDAQDLAEELAKEAQELQKLDFDVSESLEIIEATENALADSNFKAFKSLLSEAKKSINVVTRSKKLREELDETRKAVEGLKARGAITLESEILLSEAEEALRLRNLSKVKDFVKAVKKWIDIEILERERHDLLVAQDLKEISEKLVNLPPQVEEFQKLGIDTSAMDEILRRATEALEEQDHFAARRYILELDEIIRSLKGSSLRAARDAIDRAKDRIENARTQGIGVLVAERSLGQAEKAFVRGEYKDSIDFAQLAITFIKRSLGRQAVTRSAVEPDVDYTEALMTIGRMVSERVHISDESVEKHEEKEEYADESIDDLESTYMTLRAQEDLESIRTAIDDSDKKIAGLNEAKIMLRKAHDAFKVENYAAVTVLERTVRDLLKDGKSKKARSSA